VARGSGSQPADVNRLLKQYMQMEKMMSKMANGGIKGLMRQMGGAMKGMTGGGMPPGNLPRH
jgi:signal recognition particle subunit SRP54